MNETPLSLEQLTAVLKRLAADPALGTPEHKSYPVEAWNPSHCGDIGLEIMRDGVWRHEGVRMTRESLVRLFASLLRKDADGATYVVTPAEKILVRVADAPFVAVRVDRTEENGNQVLLFTTNVGDVTAAGPDRPIRVTYDPATGEPRPYVLVRGRLEARILRAPFYELAEWAQSRDGAMGVWSGGAFFPIGPAP